MSLTTRGLRSSQICGRAALGMCRNFGQMDLRSTRSPGSRSTRSRAARGVGTFTLKGDACPGDSALVGRTIASVLAGRLATRSLRRHSDDATLSHMGRGESRLAQTRALTCEICQKRVERPCSVAFRPDVDGAPSIALDASRPVVDARALEKSGGCRPPGDSLRYCRTALLYFLSLAVAAVETAVVPFSE